VEVMVEEVEEALRAGGKAPYAATSTTSLLHRPHLCHVFSL